MGVYLDRQRLERAFTPHVIQKLLDDKPNGFANENALEELIFEVEGLVNGALRGIYELPLQGPLDPMVVVVALDVFRWRGAQRHPRVFTGKVEDYERDARAWLTQLRDHDMQISHALNQGAGIPEVISDESRHLDQLTRSRGRGEGRLPLGYKPPWED